ncbi:hypothetical protein L873DRAFT_41963 [Choiromyces venosus 120613-1]|uniref:Uncharacterized protein n=1 Tax=Choiromyces venosus 120613-1 TaxID=1336337 RepID=A0A3N4K006_9PEZI|nr:hypothetical protein L873DRAFT_41963 [Choiromyces venosus 120613-1]
MSEIIQVTFYAYDHYTCGHTIRASEQRACDSLDTFNDPICTSTIRLLPERCPVCECTHQVIPKEEFKNWYLSDKYVTLEQSLSIQEWLVNIPLYKSEEVLGSEDSEGKMSEPSSPLSGDDIKRKSLVRKTVPSGKRLEAKETAVVSDCATN